MDDFTRYNLVIVRNKNDVFSGAYCPHDDRVEIGDIVKLENGEMATVMMVNDYAKLEDLKAHINTGLDYQRISSIYRNREVEWEDSDGKVV